MPSPIGEPGYGTNAPNPLNNVYFGEQHLHTVNLPDAFAFGTRNTPDDAYRFCKGEAIKKSTTGETVQKGTAYDWCAVTDHAEYLGIMPLLLEKDNPLQKQKAAANRHYAPGEFTTLIAFEWTSQAMSENLHHNVFFRDNRGPDTIFSSFDSIERQ